MTLNYICQDMDVALRHSDPFVLKDSTSEAFIRFKGQVCKILKGSIDMKKKQKTTNIYP